MTPGAYLSQLVLDRACRMLLSEDDSIAAGRGKTGLFRSVLFYKYFRRQMSMTPERIQAADAKGLKKT